MHSPDFPNNEAQRQAALDNASLLDTHPEERFDRFTRMASTAFGVPIALVSLVDTNRQWFKSCQGLPVSETPRDISFCGHAILQSGTFVVEDTFEDERFRDNPLVTGDPLIRFYAGALLHDKDGFRLGTLCIIDRKPRRFDDDDRQLLREFADCVEREINLQAASERYNHEYEALRILNQLALHSETDDDALIEKALRLGADFLDLPLAIVSEITSRVYSIRWFVAPEDSGLARDATFPLDDTYCSLMLDKREALAIDHMAKSEYRKQSCYQLFGLESYLAAPITTREGLFGTLNFSSPEPREGGFTDTEVTFVTLLARWISGVIERRLHQKMLSTLVEQTPGALYQFRLWPDGHASVPFASAHIFDIYGVRAQDVEQDAKALFDKIHPDDIGDVYASIQESAETLSIWHNQHRVCTDTVEGRWVEGNASPELLPDKSILWHGYVADIDESKRTELALQESEAQLRRLYELSPIGIALNDYVTGEFLDVNDAMLTPTGYQREQLLGKNFDALLPDSCKPVRQRMIDELSTHSRYGPFELDLLNAAGSTYPAILSGMKIRTPAGNPLVWTLVEDISERKKVDRMKSEFISTVSHELRTPLTAIAGSLGLITSGTLGELPAPVSRMAAIAYRNSEQLKQLVDDLLDIEKLVSGRMTMKVSEISLLPVIQESVERLKTYATGSGVEVVIAAGFDDRTVPADRFRLGQAFTNLLSNAIKFSPANGQVDIKTEVSAHQLRILVQDRGPGVPNHFRDRIFQKFAQADSSDTRGKAGTGLGLAITKEIMIQMGGDVGFESTEGQGATFWLELPTD